MAYPTVITPTEVTLQFPQIVDPNPADAEVHPNAWTATVWFDKDDEDMMAQWDEVCALALVEKYGTKKPPKKFVYAELLDGDEETYEDSDGEDQPVAPNMWGFRVKANSKRKPVVKDRYGNEVIQEQLGYNPTCKLKWSPYVYDNKFGIGMIFSPSAFVIKDFGESGGQADDEGMEYETDDELLGS